MNFLSIYLPWGIDNPACLSVTRFCVFATTDILFSSPEVKGGGKIARAFGGGVMGGYYG